MRLGNLKINFRLRSAFTIFVPKITAMTVTLHITADSPEARSFIKHAKSLPYVEVKRSKKEEVFERIPGLAYTREERIASALRGMEDHRAGRVISHEEMGKQIASW